jgi:serine/threonine protein kinase
MPYSLSDFQHREPGDLQMPDINPENDPEGYRILHYENFRAIKVLTESSQASIFIGNLRNYDNIINSDRSYVVGKIVVLKQFQLKKERTGFKKELKILKKIKSLDLKNNGGFPVVISAKLSNSLGEILMSYAGKDIFEVFNIQQSLEDSRKHRCLNLQNLSTMGMQIVSQLEILHKLGYTHGDLKFQNICFSEETQRYSIIDFALVNKIFHKNGEHKEQEKVKSFYGNSLFASDSMVNLMTTSRKDDLESLIYILCYLYTGTLPIIEFINADISNINMSQFLAEVLKYRVNNAEKCRSRIKQLLPENLVPAFQYVLNLKHDAKPDYNLIKLWMACSYEDERQVFATKLLIKNERMAKDILYEHSFKDQKLRQRPNQGQGDGQAQQNQNVSSGPGA